MKCDKAQEFFSDYIENTLDRPMTVALEAHLSGCESCSADVASLRSMWVVLDKVPQVEPPADFVWRTTTRLQNELLNRREAERAKALPWWKRLTPIQSFSMAGIAALLVIGLTVPISTPVGKTTAWGYVVQRGVDRTPDAVQPAAVITPPQFGVQFPGQSGAAATVMVQPTSQMPSAWITMTYLVPFQGQWVGRPQRVLTPRELDPRQSYAVPVQAGSSQVVEVRVVSREVKPDQSLTDHAFVKRLILPGAAPSDGSLQGVDPYLALQQVAARTGQAMLVDADLTGSVTVDLRNLAPQQALDQVLGQIGARAQAQSNGVVAITK